jgi:hypothetical protein
VCGIFALRGGELIEMYEQPFEAERDLQRYLATHTELLSAEAPDDERRRWLLVRREMGVADREDAGDRWSLDHLFVDQDAIPTFVEVKRSSNTEIRRKVVGQMLDYAANASAYWDAGRLRSSFESRFNSAEAANEELADFIEGEQEADEFWDAVAANLEERRLRLVFVADRIPPELRSIVEFLNEQLQLTEVIAVEVKQYVERDGEQANIVPRIIGETEMARRVKRPGGGARRPRATEEQFCAEMRAAYAPELAERVLALYEYAKARGSRRTFGRGKFASTTVWMGEHEDPEIANPVAVRFGERHVTVLMRHLRSRRTPEEMTRLVQLLRRLPGTSQALDDAVAKDYRTVCDFPADEVLATDEDLEKFKRVLDDAAVRVPTGA